MPPKHSAQDGTAKVCPACNAALSPDTVLCVACGYHLKLGRRLMTAVGQECFNAPDNNPYAPPAAGYAGLPTHEREAVLFDLTPAGVRRAKAIVSEAESVLRGMFLLWCVCAPAALAMLPWYAYRLYCWQQLNRTFAELRAPNSFSPHGELAVKFQAAYSKLLIGVISGAIYWGLLVLILALRILEAAFAFPDN